MSSRLSSVGEEGPAVSPSDRSGRRRSSTTGKGVKSGASTGPRRGSQLSPTSEGIPTSPAWNDDDYEGIDDGARPTSSRRQERKQSIPLAPPTPEDDSFYDDDEGQGSDKVLGGWHYAPLIIAILPPLGAVIGGQADAWSDAILLLLATFWLYQFLKVPHDIYHAARTRRILQADAEVQEDAGAAGEDGTSGTKYADAMHRKRERVAAAAELRRAEMLSLIALVLSPVAGAWLLTWMMEVFTDGNRYLNKFNIRLFMLASGIKPWSHALSLFRQRVLHLLEVVHYPSSRVETLNKRLTRLEADLSTLRRLVATKSDVNLLREGIDMPLTQLSRNMRRYEKKEEYLRMSAEDKFSLVESRLEDLLREVAINAELIEEERRERQRASSLPASVFQALRYALGQRGQDQAYDGQRSLPSSHVSLGITAHPNNEMAHNGGGKPIGGVAADGPPAYTSPTRSGMHQHAPAQSAPEPGWTEAGLTSWMLLPITIPRSVIRSALSFAGGQVSAARDVNYVQSYAAVTGNPSVAGPNPSSLTAQTANGKAGSGPQHHRLSPNGNGKSRAAYVDRVDTRTTASPVGTPGHFSRRV